jgi:hypothetical protein
MRTVRYAIKALKKADLIACDSRGAGTKGVYQLLLIADDGGVSPGPEVEE